jgi:hypothetical protein
MNFIYVYRQIEQIKVKEDNMATKDVTGAIKDLMKKPEQIRNIGIVAHI